MASKGSLDIDMKDLKTAVGDLMGYIDSDALSSGIVDAANRVDAELGNVEITLADERAEWANDVEEARAAAQDASD